MQNKTVFVTRPNYEPTTSYLSHWALEVLAEAARKNAKVIDLAGEKVTRKEFEGSQQQRSV